MSDVGEETRKEGPLRAAGSTTPLEETRKEGPLRAAGSTTPLEETRKFQGNWRQVAYERDGVASPVDEESGWSPRTTFAGNEFVVTIADGTTPIRGTFAVDPTQEPKAVDYTDTHGADAGKTFPAIYYFEDDRLVFCAAGSGEPRPTSFRTTMGQVLRTFVRER